MRILYTGPFKLEDVTEPRRQALIRLGHEVIGVDRVPYLAKWPYLIRKAQTRLLIGPAIAAYNYDLSEKARSSKPDLIYVDQGGYLWPRTVRALKSTGAKLVHSTTDFLGFQSYWFRHFFKAVHLYDTHVITNSLNEPLLKQKGARQIIVTEFGYNPDFHRPIPLTGQDQIAYESDVALFGHWEPHYENMIVSLRRAGIKVRVWGSGWWKARSIEDRFRIKQLQGDDYIKAVMCTKICPGLLSALNHSKAAQRTFEIPAIGRFLLAERTEDHLSCYREGKEAEFFSSTDELVEKTRYYLAHEEERESIAAAGHRRCLTSGYRYQDRVQKMLEVIGGC